MATWGHDSDESRYISHGDEDESTRSCNKLLQTRQSNLETSVGSVKFFMNANLHALVIHE